MAYEHLGPTVETAADTIMERELSRISYIVGLVQDNAPQLEAAFFGNAARPESEEGEDVLFHMTASALRLVELESTGVLTAPRIRSAAGQSLDRAVVRLGWATTELLPDSITILRPHRTQKYLIVPTEQGRGIVNELRAASGEPPVEEQRDMNRLVWLRHIEDTRQLRVVRDPAVRQKSDN